jgi:DNA-binding SARP family transcriptional activator
MSTSTMKRWPTNPPARAMTPRQSHAVRVESDDPKEGMQQSLRISLFGGFALHHGDVRIDFPSRKAKALIAYLALLPGRRATREHLIGMFWSETEGVKARASLRQLLHSLRDVLHHFAPPSNRFEVSLDPFTVSTDVGNALESALKGNPLDCLLTEALITDTILAGYENVDPSFDEWLQIQRESVRQQLIRHLEEQIAHTSHPKPVMRRLALALIQIDPTHEMACRELMRMSVDAGDVAGALGIYNRLWHLLDSDFDMEPSIATQRLVAEIKSGAYLPPELAMNRQDADNAANCAFVTVRMTTSIQQSTPWQFIEPRHSQALRLPFANYLGIPYGMKRRFS